MKTAIIVDAACDLPWDYCTQNDIHIIPLGVELNKEHLLDKRDPDVTRQFYQEYSHFRSTTTHSVPPPVEIVQRYFNRHILDHYDQAIVMCLSASRSRSYSVINDLCHHLPGAQNTQHAYSGGAPRLKTLRVMDTRTLYTGQALLAHEAFLACSLVDELDMDELHNMLQALSKNIRVYVVPDDLYYIRSRAAIRGKYSVGTLSYSMGKTFDKIPILQMEDGDTKRVLSGDGFHDAVDRMFALIKQEIDKGLMINAVMLSYSGNVRELMVQDRFGDLQKHADESGISIYLSTMGTAAGINFGPGAISVACCG